MRKSQKKLLVSTAVPSAAYVAPPVSKVSAANSPDLAVRIHEAALVCGYENCGIIRVAEMSEYEAAIASRIGRFPESRPMYTRFAHYAEPKNEHPWAGSIVVCTRWYGKYVIPEHLEGIIAKYFLVDTRLDARSKAYQDSIRFEDSLRGMGLRVEGKKDFGITAMRWAAMRAGIGIIRQNNFLYTEKGSWHELEAFFIDRDLELKHSQALKACPKKCDLCRRACPTGALAEPFQTNGMACMTYLTCFAVCGPNKKHYDKTGSWIFGCDACQDACPFNKEAWKATEKYPGLNELGAYLFYEQILDMSYPELRALLSMKFWYIKEEDAWKWKCNVLNAMRNTYVAHYLPHIDKARQDDNENVRAMAEWVFGSVTEPRPTSEREKGKDAL